MKTAVSIPDPLFKASERAARKLGVSRSGLYARALERYLQQMDDDALTAKLDAVYAEESSALDSRVAELQARSLPPESWK
jgi:metal-responsive CopG/Arc/MetJ family transcriptional regulator